jgi:hypothetical protein
MASHWPFGHLQPKLWAKEGPGVKLAIWLPTIKSRESTLSWRRLRECDIALERSRWGLQFWLKPCYDQTSQSGIMVVQSFGSPVGVVSGLHFGSPNKMCHLDVASTASCREYYREWGCGLLPSPGRGESCVSKCPWQVPTPKSVPNAELTSCGWFLDADSHELN